MAKASGGGSIGGRRGGKVSSEMTMGSAKKLQRNSGGKPTLGTTASNTKPTAKPGKKTK